MALAPAYPKVLRSIYDRTTLFYHVHIPKTGGTTVANLLVADICAPDSDRIELANWADHCNKSCEMGLTDNEFSCYPDRNVVEHNAWMWNLKRATDLLAKIGATRVVFVTTLRRGSDRVVSQWIAELGYKSYVPPAGMEPHSMESLRHYILALPHTGQSWIAGGNPSLRNNLAVGLLSSKLQWNNPNPLTRQDLEDAKQVLLTGEWLIGFSPCMHTLQERLMDYSRFVHGRVIDKIVPVKVETSASKVQIDAETQAMLDQNAALDNELYDWAWSLANSNMARFAGTC
jgi:hypothetical protein